MEGVFELPPGLLERPELGDLRERVDGDSGELVLARRVGSEGRSRAFVQGRSASAADLRELGGALVAFFGQHEHRRLTVASAQLELLDGFCGAAHLEAREALGEAHARVRGLAAQLDELSGRAGARDRDLDLLAFEIEEIDSLGPSESEKQSLLAERGRLRQLDGLLAAAAGGAEAIDPDGGDGAAGVAALLAQAESLAAPVDGADPELDALAARLATLRIEAEDLGAELRRYAEGLEAEPGRIEQVEERLELYDRLERKHGGSVEAVLEHAERCRAERERLEGAEVALERARDELERAGAERERLAARVTKARAKAAPKLAERVLEELAALAMEDARFEVHLEPREEIGPTGAERVEFMLAPEPRRAGRARARERLGRRAVPGDARADDRRGRGRLGHARVRRGGRRRGRPDRPRGGRAAARARRGAPGALHHAPAADRRAGGRPLPHRESRPRASWRWPASRRSTGRPSWPSCAGCWARRPPMPAPAGTPRSSWRRRLRRPPPAWV